MPWWDLIEEKWEKRVTEPKAIKPERKIVRWLCVNCAVSRNFAHPNKFDTCLLCGLKCNLVPKFEPLDFGNHDDAVYRPSLTFKGIPIIWDEPIKVEQVFHDFSGGKFNEYFNSEWSYKTIKDKFNRDTFEDLWKLLNEMPNRAPWSM